MCFDVERVYEGHLPLVNSTVEPDSAYLVAYNVRVCGDLNHPSIPGPVRLPRRGVAAISVCISRCLRVRRYERPRVGRR